MKTENLWQRVRQNPFQPFQLHLSSGEVYDVRRREVILVSRNNLTIGIMDEGSPGGQLPSREVFISPLHVCSVEDLPIESSAA